MYLYRHLSRQRPRRNSQLRQRASENLSSQYGHILIEASLTEVIWHYHSTSSGVIYNHGLSFFCEFADVKAERVFILLSQLNTL